MREVFLPSFFAKKEGFLQKKNKEKYKDFSNKIKPTF